MSLENLRQNRYLTAEFVHNTTQRLDFYQYNPMHIIVEITSINSKKCARDLKWSRKKYK